MKLRQKNKFSLAYKRSKLGIMSLKKAWELYFRHKGLSLNCLQAHRSDFCKKAEWQDIFPPQKRSGINLGLYIDDESIRQAEKAECERLYFEIKSFGLSDYAIAGFMQKLGLKSKDSNLKLLYAFKFNDATRERFLTGFYALVKALKQGEYKWQKDR